MFRGILCPFSIFGHQNRIKVRMSTNKITLSWIKLQVVRCTTMNGRMDIDFYSYRRQDI